MISKILITLAVIAACMMMLSSRARPELRTVANPQQERKKKQLRIAAFAFMFVMVIAAGVMIYFELDKRSAVVIVHVINTQSGASKSYRAMKQDIQSDNFITLDGLQVFVAGVERIEVEAR